MDSIVIVLIVVVIVIVDIKAIHIINMDTAITSVSAKEVRIVAVDEGWNASNRVLYDYHM